MITRADAVDAGRLLGRRRRLPATRRPTSTTYPGVWRHGDWITITERGSCVITGRSDATLNRGGVRLGTAEFYAVVEALPEVADSLVVHLEDADGGPGELLLFVVLRDGVAARRRAAGPDPRRAARRSSRRGTCRTQIHEVAAVPRTLSGKKLEVPVKRILHGMPPDAAAAKDALADPRVPRAVRGPGPGTAAARHLTSPGAWVRPCSRGPRLSPATLDDRG